MSVYLDCKSLTGVGRYILHRPGCSPLAKKVSLVVLAVIAILAVAALKIYTPLVVISVALALATLTWALPLKLSPIVDYNPVKRLAITEEYVKSLEDAVEAGNFSSLIAFLKDIPEDHIKEMKRANLLSAKIFPLIQKGIEKEKFSNEWIQDLLPKIRRCNAFQDLNGNVEIVIKTGQVFRVNKLVLLMASPHFKLLFDAPSYKGKIVASTLSFNAAYYLIPYLYNGSLLEENTLLEDWFILYDYGQMSLLDDLKVLVGKRIVNYGTQCENQTKLEELLHFFSEPEHGEKSQSLLQDPESIIVIDSEIRQRLVDTAVTTFFNQTCGKLYGLCRLTQDSFKIPLQLIYLMADKSIIAAYLKSKVTPLYWQITLGQQARML